MNEIDLLRQKLIYSNQAKDLYDLAQCYDLINQFGNPNPHFNNFRRLYWYLKSGNMGYSEAFNNLGFIIEHELNINKRNERALKYYKRACQMGSKLGKENYFLSMRQNQQ
jgi:TPR repeat protein